MKTLRKFKCGSSYFFSRYRDYKLKDDDEVHVCDKLLGKSTVLNLKKDGMDIFFVKDMSPKEHIESCLGPGVPPMRAGKYLIPEFNIYIGFSIEDLKALDECFERMDKKHTYEKIIYEAYIENGGFYLTDEQRERAYEEYKRTRPDIYGIKEEATS